MTDTPKDQTPDLEDDLAREVDAIVEGMNNEKWQETRDKIRHLVVKARNRRHAMTGEPIRPLSPGSRDAVENDVRLLTTAQLERVIALRTADEDAADDEVVETMNDCAVALGPGERIAIIRFGTTLDKETALRLAAWIVVISGDGPRFRKILRAIENT